MKFRNEAYTDLVNDVVFDAFYAERTNRGKIASIRQYAEIVVRKILDIPENDVVTLGNKAIVKQLELVSNNSQLLMSSIEKIRLIGNKCTHTQEIGEITDDDVRDCINCLFNIYASIFVIYFQKNKFGSKNEVMSAFSILPPIIRYLTLNELYKEYPDNLSIIDKLSLVLLKAFDKDQAIQWVEDRKEKLSNTLPYTEEAIDEIKQKYGPEVAQQTIKNAPSNMYISCLDRINDVDEIIQRNGLLYSNFEQAKELYLKKGILTGSSREISYFNSIMEFVYLGRKKENNPKLEEINSYFILK